MIMIHSGTPAGTVLGMAMAQVAAQSTGTQTLARFTFSSPVAVTPGTPFVIEWVSVDSSLISWAGTDGTVGSGGPYASGTAFGCDGLAVADSDYNFVTYSSV
jgi:hypothetical protein